MLFRSKPLIPLSQKPCSEKPFCHVVILQDLDSFGGGLDAMDNEPVVNGFAEEVGYVKIIYAASYGGNVC